MPRQQHTLSSDWRWRLANSNGVSKAEEDTKLKEWTPVASFPSVIQMELLAKKLIPDPNVGENERLIQWVGEADWEYACSFRTPEAVVATAEFGNVDLVFEGLDTFAKVTLNGKEILKSDNMFLSHRVPVKELLNGPDEDNELSIIFESALKRVKELEDTFGVRKSMMRDAKRMHTRKAQVYGRCRVQKGVCREADKQSLIIVPLGLGLGSYRRDSGTLHSHSLGGVYLTNPACTRHHVRFAARPLVRRHIGCSPGD